MQVPPFAQGELLHSLIDEAHWKP